MSPKICAKISRRAFTAGVAAVAAPAVIRSGRAHAAPAKVSHALPWIPHGGYAFLFAAKKLGYWASRGLDVQIDRGFGSGETCKRVALGQYDFGLADFATMVKLVDDGPPLSGRPSRVLMLKEFMDYVRCFENVWLPSPIDVVEYWRSAHQRGGM
jgi:hypothetical protein